MTEAADTGASVATETGEQQPAITKEMLPDIAKEELIAPPPELRSIVDVTVDYVVRNGINFEGELRKRQQSNRKFDFLIPGNPYYKWYKWKLTCKIDPKAAAEAEKMAAEEKATQAELLKETKAEREKAMDSIKVVELTLAQRIEQEMKLYRMCKEDNKVKLPDLKCSVPLPTMVTPFEVDLIKLTAQFVARNGRQFVSALTQSQMNQRFHFLNPVDPRFGYFQKLITAYNECIVLPKDIISELEKDLDADKLYQSCLGHAVCATEEAEAQKREAADIEAEEIAMRLIDWNDFAIVETITFDTENEYYPAPGKDIEAVNELLDMENRKEIKVVLADDVESDMEVEMEGLESSDDEEEIAEGGDQVQKIEAAKSEPTKENAKEEPSKPAAPPVHQGTDTIVTADLGGEIRLETDENKQLREMLETNLLTSHTPGSFVKCPVTGQMVESSRLGEHIRISLLDPKWKEQRDHLINRMQKSSLAVNQDIVSNLRTFQREHDLIMRGGDVGKKKADGTVGEPSAVQSADPARLREAEEQAALRKQLRQQTGGEPPAKRRRPNMVPSAQWLASHPGPQTFRVEVLGKFHQITLACANMVMDLKVQVQNLSGLDPAKQLISTREGVVLDNDGAALADFNLQTGSNLSVSSL